MEQNGDAHLNNGEEYEDDGEGEFVVIGKKHQQRGTKTRMRFRGGGNGGGGGGSGNGNNGGGGGGHNHNRYRDRIPLSHLPYHPSNIRRQQLLQEQLNNANNNNNDTNGSAASVTSNNASTSSNAKVPSVSSSNSGPASTMSSGHGSNSDAASSTTGDVNNVNELQPDLDEISKPKFIEAPPPALNPWKVYNAASVLGKKTPLTNGISETLKSASNGSTNGLPKITDGPRTSTSTSSTNITTTPATANVKKMPSFLQAALKLSNQPDAAPKQEPTVAPAPVKTSHAPATTTSSSAQTTASAPGPWVSGRVLKLRQNSPNYAEKLRSSDWPSLSEVVNQTASMKVTEDIAVNDNNNGTAHDNNVGKTTVSTSTQTQTEKVKTSPSSSPTQTEKEKSTSNKERFEGDSRGRYVRGRGRGGASMRGGSSSRGRPSSASGHYKDQNGFHANQGTQDYTDYPPDFTTIIPAYSTVSEFIMPYVAPACRVTPIIRPDMSELSFFVSSIVDRTGLVKMVRQQIEYYFSQENLEKDFYLRRKMDPEGYLPIKLIASFQRVQNMTTDYTVVIEAIQSSPELDMKQATSSVRTKNDPCKWPIADGAHFYSHLYEVSAAPPSLPTFD